MWQHVARYDKRWQHLRTQNNVTTCNKHVCPDPVWKPLTPHASSTACMFMWMCPVAVMILLLLIIVTAVMIVIIVKVTDSDSNNSSVFDGALRRPVV